MKYQKLQTKVKALAESVKSLKAKRKESEYGYVPGLLNERYQARHYHVAYSMLLGNKYEDIERNPREEINKKYIEQLMEKYDETLCTSRPEAV